MKLIPRPGFNRNFIRFQSSQSSQSIPQIRRRATFRDLLKSPTTKSLLLTVMFGSAVTEMIARRKKLENLRETHRVKTLLLQDIKDRLVKGEPVNLQQELKLLNNLSLEPSDVDIEFDETLQEIFKMDQEVSDEKKKKSTKPDTRKDSSLTPGAPTTPVTASNKFL